MDFNQLILNFPKSKLNIKKIMYIILKKLELNQILVDTWVSDKSIELSFKKNEDVLEYSSKKRFYFQNEESESFGSLTLVIEIYKTSEKPKLIYSFTINDDIQLLNEKIYKNYLPTKEFGKNNTCFTLNKSFNIDENNNTIIDSYFTQKINELFKSILFFDKHQNDFIPFMIYLEQCAKNNDKNEQNNLNTISKCYSFKNLFEVDNIITSPKKENKFRIIDSIINNRNLFQKSKIFTFKAIGTNYHITINTKDIIDIIFNGFNIFHGKYIERYKFINHPGLNFFIKYLEHIDQIDIFDYNMQKVLLKTL